MLAIFLIERLGAIKYLIIDGGLKVKADLHLQETREVFCRTRVFQALHHMSTVSTFVLFQHALTPLSALANTFVSVPTKESIGFCQ